MPANITPYLWFDDQAEEAALYYTSIFKNSRIREIVRYPDAGQEVHGKPAGSVMVVEFELDGRPFTGLNGGPHFKFTEAISLQVECATQEELDYYWEKLTQGGDPEAQQCGWLKDKYGLSWQIVPSALGRLMSSGEPARSQRVGAALMAMNKLDIDALQRAHDGA